MQVLGPYGRKYESTGHLRDTVTTFHNPLEAGTEHSTLLCHNSLQIQRYYNSQFTHKICQLRHEAPVLDTSKIDFRLELTNIKTLPWQCG